MRVLDYSGPRSVPLALPLDTAAVIGAFDGMHLGHQALIQRARAGSERVAVVTFEPRPVDVLAPERSLPRLQSPSQRERVCRDLGVDLLVVLRFDHAVSRLDPSTFVTRFLFDGLRPGQVIVGYDFHFGAGRAGGPRVLAELLVPGGIGVEIVEPVTVGDTGQKVGSTAIRELVDRGEVEQAADLLGRWFAVEGEVVHGAARGRQLGFPTANVRSSNMHPAPGVYSCFLTLLDPGDPAETECWPAVANLGTHPTFADGGTTTLEVHALDVDLGDRLYGQKVEVAFVARLRDETKFATSDDLRAAIGRDVVQARARLVGAADRLHARPIRSGGG